jgi:hypothetical protein
MAGELLLILALLQQPSPAVVADDPTVAVILANKDCAESHSYPASCSDAVIMKVSVARKKHDDLAAREREGQLSRDEERLYTALVLALGTLPDNVVVDTSCLSTQEKEHRRWQRQPAQATKLCPSRSTEDKP